MCGLAKDAVEIPATGAGALDDDAEGDVPATEHAAVLPWTGDVSAFASASIAAFALVGIMVGVALQRSRAR